MKSFRSRLSEITACGKTNPGEVDQSVISFSSQHISHNTSYFDSNTSVAFEEEPGINKLLPGPASGVDPDDDETIEGGIPLGDTDLGIAAKTVARWVLRQGSFREAASAAQISLQPNNLIFDSPACAISFWTLQDATVRLPQALVSIRQVLREPNIAAASCGELILADALGCTIRASVHPQASTDASTIRALSRGGALVLREVRPLQLSAATELLLLITVRSLVAVFEPSGFAGLEEEMKAKSEVTAGWMSPREVTQNAENDTITRNDLFPSKRGKFEMKKETQWTDFFTSSTNDATQNRRVQEMTMNISESRPSSSIADLDSQMSLKSRMLRRPDSPSCAATATLKRSDSMDLFASLNGRETQLPSNISALNVNSTQRLDHEKSRARHENKPNMGSSSSPNEVENEFEGSFFFSTQVPCLSTVNLKGNNRNQNLDVIAESSNLLTQIKTEAHVPFQTTQTHLRIDSVNNSPESSKDDEEEFFF